MLKNPNPLDAVRKSYEELVSLDRELAAKLPALHLRDLATSLHTLGYLQVKLKQSEDARRTLTEALDLRRKLAAGQPAQFLPEVAETLSIQAVLEVQEGRLDEAFAALNEALQTLEPLVAENLAGLGQQLERTREALTAIERGLAARKSGVPEVAGHPHLRLCSP